MNAQDFNDMMLLAKSGDQNAVHLIWSMICEKQMKAYFKSDYSENVGLAYIAFIKALELYDMSKLPPDKTHRWQFPAYFKQRIRYTLQDERQRMSHPCRITDYAFKTGDIPIRVEAGEELAYVEY